jgi:Na+-transporting methylmalonyl-CoA/oxaloacetate decarboxylase gamma subunit
MNTIIQQGLMITLIGMGLVFAVIIFLWWLMNLLVRATSKEADQESDAPEARTGKDAGQVPQMVVVERHRRAAAAAVAVGLAIAQCQANGSKEPPAGTTGMSPWQSVQRARQLQQHKRG